MRNNKIENISHIIKITKPDFWRRTRGTRHASSQIGHMRAECAAPYCTDRSQFEHREPECIKKTSTYALAAGAV